MDKQKVVEGKEDINQTENLGSHESPRILSSNCEMEIIEENGQGQQDACIIFDKIMEEQNNEDKEIEVVQSLFTQSDTEQQMKTKAFIVADNKEETVLNRVIMHAEATAIADVAKEDDNHKMPPSIDEELSCNSDDDKYDDNYIPSSTSSAEPMEEDLADFDPEENNFKQVVNKDKDKTKTKI